MSLWLSHTGMLTRHFTLTVLAIFASHAGASPTQHEIAASLATGDMSPCTVVLYELDYHWISVRNFHKIVC